MEHPITVLSRRYPQLLLPLGEQTRFSPEYKAAVLQGKPLTAEPAFLGSPEDSLTVCTTPAGQVPVLVLGNRTDFEHAMQALAYRCEPRPILPSVGASTIRGLINWETIYNHQADYLASGGTDWPEEFDRFTSVPANFRDTVILLSIGAYSSVPAEEAGCTPEAWLAHSLTIRKYHELTHFICRTLWPENIDALRDEVIADAVGLLFAFGRYDPILAARFLGIRENGSFLPGGRLEHYLTSPDTLPQAITEVSAQIKQLSQHLTPAPADPFSILEGLYGR